MDVGPYSLYLRQGAPIPVNHERLMNPLQLANVSNKNDQLRGLEYLPPEERRPRGQFRELITLLEEAAKRNGMDGIYAENIMNEFLPEVLARYGYVRDDFSIPRIPSMYKRF